MDRHRRPRRFFGGGGNTIIGWFLCILPVVLLLVIITGCQTRPLHILQSRGLLLLRGEGEVNPVKAKFPTRPDSGMAYPYFHIPVLVEDKTSAYNDELWSITETAFNPGIFYKRVPLSNGYFGTTVSAAGPFFERDVNQTNINGDTPIEGWPLDNVRQTFSTISGFYDCQEKTARTNFEDLIDRGCESVISGLPHPMGIYLTVGNQTLDSTVDPGTIHSFSETLSFRDGIVSWEYTWSPTGTDTQYDIRMTTLVSRDKRNVAATRLSVTPRGGNTTVSIADFIDGRGGVRSFLGTRGVYNGSIHVSVHPDGLPNVTAWLVSTLDISSDYIDESSRRIILDSDVNDTMSISQEWDANLIDGETAVFDKYIGISSTDGFPMNAESVARNASSTALENRWDTLYAEHVKAWNFIMDENTITTFYDPSTGRLPVNDTIMEMYQIQEIASRYYLLSNVQANDGSGLNDNGVAVGGLTSDTYAGNLFWDQDFWMYPGMALTHPDYASQIIKSRDKHFEAAKANAQEPYVQAKYKFDSESSLYPWMTGRFGNATAMGPALDYEYHLNGVIALAAIHEYYITGNETAFKMDHWERIKSCVHTFMGLVVKEGSHYSIRNVTEPDEYATWKNNGAFTNTIFSEVTNITLELQRKFGEPVNETWAEVAANIFIAKSPSGITLEFEGMNNTVHIKQADVTLLIYPLSPTSMSLEQKNRDLAYYNQRAEPDGPAMTAAIAATAENRIAISGCAASIYYSQATAPFLRAPWYQMSEQANDDMNGNGGIAPAYPFLTAHGGAIQFPHFGLLGISLNNETLHIRPSLPMPFINVRLGDFYFQGNRIRAKMNTTHTKLTRLENLRVDGLVNIYADRLMPIAVQRRNENMDDFNTTIYTLTMNQTITVENDMYWTHLTTPGNVLQCQPTITKASNVLGQYPGAVNDGDPGTRFQPGHRNRTAVIIDTSKRGFKRLDRFRIDWGSRPANNFTVRLTNSTDPITTVSEEDFIIHLEVTPNTIYGDGESMAEVVPYVGNFTEVWFPGESEIWSGNYSILEFEGCKDCAEDTMGATVGEFELIATEKFDVQEDMMKGLGDQTAELRQGSDDVDKVQNEGESKRSQAWRVV